jgi:WD40 repeat protein
MPDQANIPVSQLYLVPRRPGHLRGRDEDLQRIDRLLTADGAMAAITPALTGQGGIGKTQLAALYAHERGGQFVGGTFWMTLAVPNREAIIGQFVSFARGCGIKPEESGSEEQQNRAMAERWLGKYGSRSDVLLILDNIEQPKLLIEPLPGLPNHRLRDLGCRKLVTSRREDLQGCRLLRLDNLPPEIARSVLIEAAERGHKVYEEDGLDQLLRLLGGLPLALRLAGALLSKRPETSYDRLAKTLLGRGARDVLDESGVGLEDYRNGMSASLGAMLAETWSALPANRPELVSVVQALAQLPEAQVFPAEIVRLLVDLPHDPLGLEEDSLPEVLRALQSWNLIERPAPDRVRLHALIRADARRRCGTNFLQTLTEETARRLRDAKTLLSLGTDRIAEVARTLEALIELGPSSGAASKAVFAISSLLRVESYALRLTADPILGNADPSQFSYAAAVHGQAALKTSADKVARAQRQCHLRVLWTTAEAVRSMRHRLRGHTGRVLGCAVSVHGSIGVSASEDGTLIVWDLATGHERQRLYGHERAVLTCAISSDNRIALSGSSDKTLIVWDLAAGQICNRLLGHDDWVHDCAVSADARIGLSASSDQTLILWDLAACQQVQRLHGHNDTVTSCALSSDARTGLSASDDESLIVWDLADGRCRYRLLSHEREVNCCAVSANGRTGLSASADGSLMVWDLAAGRKRHELSGHAQGIQSCAISACGRIGLSASDDQNLKVRDLETGEERYHLGGHEAGVWGCALSAEGTVALSACDDQTLIVWNLGPGRGLHRSRGHGGWINDCAVSDDGRICISASADRTLYVWDLITGKKIHRLLGHRGEVNGCAISRDGRLGLSASEDKSLIVWDLATGRERSQLRGHEYQVSGCAMDANGQTGLSASEDGTLIVWDIETGHSRHQLRGHERSVQACAISADGRTGLSASYDGTLIVWDIETGQERCRLRGHRRGVWCCRISADGYTGLSASEDQTLIVWDLMLGQRRHHLRGHTAQVLSCSITTPDGRTGVSTSLDGTVIVWDLETGRKLHRLAIDATADAVASKPDGKRVFVGDRKGNLTCFELVSGGPRDLSFHGDSPRFATSRITSWSVAWPTNASARSALPSSG